MAYIECLGFRFVKKKLNGRQRFAFEIFEQVTAHITSVFEHKIGNLTKLFNQKSRFKK